MSDEPTPPPPLDAEPPAPQVERPVPQPLEKLPFPSFVKVLAAITAVAFTFSLIRVPGAFASGRDYEKAHNLVEKGAFEEALPRLEKVVEHYPAAEEARIDLIKAELGTRRYEEASANLYWFDGKSVNSERDEQLNFLMGQLNDAAKKERLK